MTMPKPTISAAAKPAQPADVIVRASDLGKCYQMYNSHSDRLKQALLLGRRKYYHDFWALRDVGFELRRGESLGIMGRNGSGKSTLLQLVTGTLTPTCGAVEVRGRAAALLELGAGFVPDFTGRENVYVYGTLMGLSRAEIDARFDDIAAFADIGEFIDQPVRIYSSGMYVRLAFSAAINVDPDVLIVDEALAVGDARFSARCMTKINKFRDAGVSIVFVSHDSETVKRICNEVLVLDRGQVVNRGVSVHMANWYLAFMVNDFDLEKTRRIERENAEKGLGAHKPAADSASAAPAAPAVGGSADGDSSTAAPAAPQVDCSIDRALHPEFAYFRHGDGNARVVSAGLCDAAGRSTEYVRIGEKLRCRLELEFYADLPYHIVGMHICDGRGTDIIAVNTYQERLAVPAVKNGDKLVYWFETPIDLRPGNYSITCTVAYDQYKMEWLDWIDNVLLFGVVDPDPARLIFGVYRPSELSVRLEPPAAP